MMLGIPRGRLLFLAALLIAGYFGYNAFVGMYRNQDLAEEQAGLRREVYDLAEQYRYLQGIKQYVSTDEYVEYEARTRLGYVRDGEVPFVVVSPEDENEGGTADGTWWERLFPR
jgi:cell division protein FtsB